MPLPALLSPSSYGQLHPRLPPLLQILKEADRKKIQKSFFAGHNLYHSNLKQPRRNTLRTQALFTGIVQGKGKVARVDKKNNFSTIFIQFPDEKLRGAEIGASIAINGTCLTVTDVKGDLGSFDVISETLRATNLGQLKAENEVNFERSAKVGDEIGGHNVSGHVHTTARIASVEDTENNKCVSFEVDNKWIKYILPKGFIAVEGISLTVGEVGRDCFCVYLIPETLRATTLGSKSEGGVVNIEIDAQTQAIVETVERYMQAQTDAKSHHEPALTV